MERSSGILLHISSLPSPYGIGTLGKEAYEFVDFLYKAGQSYWQMLPVCPTSFGDSPYQSFSTFAGNPYFIDLDFLHKEGLLKKKDYETLDWGSKKSSVDYAKLYQNRFVVLRKAYKAWIKNQAETLKEFYNQHHWLEDYSLFMALKDHYKGAPWWEWEDVYRLRNEAALAAFLQTHQEEVRFWGFVQYMFFDQWNQLKAYANQKGIRIIGDLPIYVARDSADVWANPEDFWLDEDLNPVRVAGCPPDSFSATGQLWGNPIYRWEEMKKGDYAWWAERLRAAIRLYDTVRIDHFRGFDSYYAIPYGDKTAENGEWMEGPGIEFFRSMEKQLGKMNVIAENLGYLTDSVCQLLEDSGYPGMKILEFAFDTRDESNYLPHTYTFNNVVYIGTHDNDTAVGWLDSARPEDVKYGKQYLRLRKREGFHWGLIKGAWACVCDLAVAQMQDFLGLGNQARMNTPSTTGDNWKWRMKAGAANDKLAKKIYRITKLYSRLPNSNND